MSLSFEMLFLVTGCDMLQMVSDLHAEVFACVM